MTAEPAPGSALATVHAALRENGSKHESGQDWTCPAHDDRQASLGVKEGETQPVLLNCQAGCTYEQVLEAIGVTKADLQPKMRVTDTYLYKDASGSPLYEVQRLEDGSGKKRFSQCPVDARGKRKRGLKQPMNGVERVLYRLPEVRRWAAAGKAIYLVEGEKAAAAVKRQGKCVTTASGGAKAEWLSSYTESLRGSRQVTIIADRDPAGYTHAAKVYDALKAAGINVEIRQSKTTNSHDDIVDHLDAGFSLAELVPMTRAELDASDAPDVERSKLGRVLSRSDLAGLPKPEPLIAGWLDLRTTVVVIGETGTNKTFAILGWACSVATGRPWLGHPVELQPSPVILVVGEGGSGLDDRISAWEEHSGVKVPPENLTIVLQPASLNDEEVWSEVTDLAASSGARLVAFDTFSSLAPDADETTDAAMVVRRMSELASAIDGTVLLAHHTGWGDKGRARGGSQLEANPDAVIVLQKSDADDPDSAVSIKRKKVKDGPSGETVHVRRVPVSERSCVLGVVGAPESRPSGSPGDLEDAVLRWVDDSDPFTFTASGLEKAMGGNHSRTRKAIKDLLNSGVLVSEKVSAPEGRNGAMKERERIGRGARLFSLKIEPRPATEPVGRG